VVTPRPTLTGSRGALSKKFPSIFYGSSPDPSAARRNEKERKFLECDGASVLQKERLLKYLLCRSFLRPLRRAEAFPSPSIVVTLYTLTLRTTSHRHTRIRSCSLLGVALCSLGGFVGVCGALHGSRFARANLYVLAPPTQCAHKPPPLFLGKL